MKKRCSERMDVILGGELICGKISYAAVVRNVSEKGISVIISPIQNNLDPIPDKDLEVVLPLSSGKHVNLQCRSIWSHRFIPAHLTRIIGLEIMAPPVNYSIFLNSLHEL